VVSALEASGGEAVPPGAPHSAAFFDLDKTVIAKSSTLAFSKSFFDQGLLNRRSVLKSSYAQFLLLMSGADHDQMDRMRSYVTSMCAGWDVEQVKAVVTETLHDIVDPLVFAEAAELIADHRLCGRDVVVVSASGGENKAAAVRELAGVEGYAVDGAGMRSRSGTGRVKVNTGESRWAASLRSARSGFTTVGWPTSASIGRSAIESEYA
jgi:phosphoserine phosphatase